MSEQSSSKTLMISSIKRPARRIAFGCEPLGGYNWGNVDLSKIERAIDQALTEASSDRCMIFDTADTYGPHKSEERLGALLKGRRENAILATKFGVRLDDGRAWYDTSPEYADKALDQSLERLATDAIDIYQLHWPDQVTSLQSSFAALEKFVEEGRIRAFGVSNIPPKHLLPLLKDFPNLSTFSLSYSLINRSQEEEIKELCDAGLIFIAYGCLAQGLLSGKYDENTVFNENDRRSSEKYVEFHGDRLKRNLKIVGSLKTAAEALNCAPATLALRFVLQNLPNSIALAGIKSPQQLNKNMDALNGQIPQAQLNHLLNISK